MEALEYKINASITGLVKTIFSLGIYMCIDDRFSIGSYIMPLATSAPGTKPYFSDDLHFGVRIVGKERVILAKYIQFNQPHAVFGLGFDVDCARAAIGWSERNAPAPTLTITNPDNGHAHLLYALQTSIRTAPDGKMKPLRSTPPPWRTRYVKN